MRRVSPPSPARLGYLTLIAALLATGGALACPETPGAGVDWRMQAETLTSLALGVSIDLPPGWCIAPPGQPDHASPDLRDSSPFALARFGDEVALVRADGRAVVLLMPMAKSPPLPQLAEEPWHVSTPLGSLLVQVGAGLAPWAVGGSGMHWVALADGNPLGIRGRIVAYGLEPEASPAAALASALGGIRALPGRERRAWALRASVAPPPDAYGEGWSLKNGRFENDDCAVSWSLFSGEVWRVRGDQRCGEVTASQAEVTIWVDAVAGADVEAVAQDLIDDGAAVFGRGPIGECSVGALTGAGVDLLVEGRVRATRCVVRQGRRTWVVSSEYLLADADRQRRTLDKALAALQLGSPPAAAPPE